VVGGGRREVVGEKEVGGEGTSNRAHGRPSG
jgi:hypothetical protein